LYLDSQRNRPEMATETRLYIYVRPIFDMYLRTMKEKLINVYCK